MSEGDETVAVVEDPKPRYVRIVQTWEVGHDKIGDKRCSTLCFEQSVAGIDLETRPPSSSSFVAEVAYCAMLPFIAIHEDALSGVRRSC